MNGRPKNLIVAAIVPLVALWAAAWFDGNVVNDAMIRAGHTYDMAPAALFSRWPT